jgi:hypothetical protein
LWSPAYHRVVIAGSKVIQPRQGVVILPGEAFGCVERAGGVTGRAVGASTNNWLLLSAALLAVLLKLASKLPSASVR